MSAYLSHYIIANVFCLAIFSIILIHDLRQVDRQEKQINYDWALVMFMLYFVTDIFWAAVIDGALPRTGFSVGLLNFLLFLFMAGIVFAWLRYALAVIELPRRNKPSTIMYLSLPFAASIVLLVLIYMIAPDTFVTPDLELKSSYYVIDMIVPLFYIIALLVYTIRQAVVTKSPVRRKQYLYVGLFPLTVVFGGLLQIIVLPDTPIFCFACTIMMSIFHIALMENKISLDPLTGLNNRGQLLRYVSIDSSLRREHRRTLVYMIDINKFKQLNDRYGHPEGDRALVLVADSLKYTGNNLNMPVFIARYGGDEFIVIAHPEEGRDIPSFEQMLRSRLTAACRANGAPYLLEVGIGCDELDPKPDTFQACLSRADQKLYKDKAARGHER